MTTERRDVPKAQQRAEKPTKTTTNPRPERRDEPRPAHTDPRQ